MEVWHYKFTINQHDIASSQLTQKLMETPNDMTECGTDVAAADVPHDRALLHHRAESTPTTVNQSTMRWMEAKNTVVLIFNLRGVFDGLFKSRVYLNLPTLLRIRHVERKTASFVFSCEVTVLSGSRISHDLRTQLSLFFVRCTVWDDFMATACCFKPH